mmetsp:Transcript_4928/g.11599  ORF Transcript_4928/g.11599 Transcript_4928/m.11599 type:complete len:294 (+) Transcript_4928:79-960(+)|eukprot:CAMPEP_0172585422 /NCGR_PEP_ID=MMETSP1068-20121228/4845_1 /TAXON_ID=35684 /ORGANISM="Pseudopedinella elastica, Strain CCMP716" /LENGTH=293 /DNA_ID=CAMNT_0013379877 /DNA_START=77 /DNA_END=958 /DNA_ORIENTATION=+
MKQAVLALCALTGASAFTFHKPLASKLSPRHAMRPESFDPFGLAEGEGNSCFGAQSASESERKGQLEGAGLALVALAALPGDAVAKGGEYGIFEGRISSLAHPVVMGVCFLVSLGAAYTGFQWRAIRDLQTDISALKTAIKAPEAALTSLEAMEEPNAAKIASLKSEISALQAEADEKTAKRKDMLALDFRDRHWALGSVLLGLGVSFAIEGPVNTFMRAGKLFPGPHLYAGAGCVSLWALAAALVPQMQKGKDWARSGHIGLNVLSTAMFAYYQIPTGLEIAAKVIEKTKFP